MCKKLHLIRGQRILNQLSQLLDETAIATLRANAAKLPSGDREAESKAVNIRQIVLTPFEQTGQLQVEGTVTSDGREYRTVIVFQEVEYQETNEASNVTFTGSDGDTYHIQPISLSSTNVKVSCECLDFYWRFAVYNSKDGSLHGPTPPPYQKKTSRASGNPQKVPGVCKHLIRTVDDLMQSGLVVN